MTRTTWGYTVTAGMVVAICAAGAAAVNAQQQWNERTTLTFSEPVMVPGATLQPGTYIFSLVDMRSTRHTVRITTENETKPIALVHAVPLKRNEPSGDIVLRFNPTTAGSPPALKAWFYPGSTYGHEFIYSDEEAKGIASPTKSVVLSEDAAGTDREKATLHTYSAEGMRASREGDALTLGEWQAWLKTRQASTDKPGGLENPRASAAMVSATAKGTRVTIGALEENPAMYVGKTISVDAEVQDIIGPRLFTIDEPNWGDLDGEILVYVPTALAALVRDYDRITVTGTVKTFVKADVEKEWGWLGLSQGVEIQYTRKPILDADQIVGGNNDAVLLLTEGTAAADRTGTGNGSNDGTMPDGAPVTDAATLADSDEASVGRHVALTGVKVERVAKDGGFFVNTGNSSLYVLPAHKDGPAISAGDTLTLRGVVLRLPRGHSKRSSAPAGSNDEIYVYATEVGR